MDEINNTHTKLMSSLGHWNSYKTFTKKDIQENFIKILIDILKNSINIRELDIDWKNFLHLKKKK